MVSSAGDPGTPTTTQQDKWLSMGGQRMHVIDTGPRHGSRGTLVMVHGNPTWSFYYRRLVAHFSNRYRCIVPDHIGMGLSSKPDDQAYPYTLGQRIADLDNLLEQLCPRGPLTLILHDWGGMIGMGYAVRHRARIARLVLMNTAAFRLPVGKDLPWSLRLCRTPLLGALAVRGLNMFCRGAVRQCIKTARLSDADQERLMAPYDNWANRIAVHRFVQDIPLRPGDTSYACVKLIERDLEQFLDCPAQIFWGGRDFVFDDDYLSHWRSIWPQAVVHRYPQAGHYVLEDAHEQIIPALDHFLETDTSSPRQAPAPRPRTDANIASHLSTMATTAPQRLAIACPVSGSWPWVTAYTELSFKRLDDWSHDIARGLVQAGIGKGTRVALLVPPGPEFFAAVFALMKTGAIMICIDPGIGLAALGRCINRAQPLAIIGSRKAHLACRLLGWGRNSNRLNIHTADNPLVLPGDRPANRSLHSIAEAGRDAGSAPLPIIEAQDPAAILFTSGSTGPPKGVKYTHATFQAQISILRECYAITPGEVDLSTFPLFALFAPALGMSAVIPKMDFTRPARVRPRNIIQAIERYGVTSLFGSPALLQRLGRWNRRHQQTLPSLRRIISAGAPVQACVLADLVPMLGPQTRIHTPYGATEILPVSTIASDEILAETAAETALGKGICVGRPVAGVRIRIIAIPDGTVVNTDPDRLNAGEVGEIVVSGPNLSLGYDGLDEAQSRVRFNDSRGRNWHRMGDAGYIDDQDRLWFCGRVAHCVKAPERTYYPIPCEGVFNNHPQVYRSALVVLHSRNSIRPGLCVELEITTPAASRPQILSELLEIGSRFEHTCEIREVFFHPAFPVDIRHNAKIDRLRLGRWARSHR